mmetsp:Transcript_46449/g.145338  ORF Transcript_46449/g.145338 Transcript_46449/m.145338 type:complete len:373 (+) Transcript_46449:1391-2509(+)
MPVDVSVCVCVAVAMTHLGDAVQYRATGGAAAAAAPFVYLFFEIGDCGCKNLGRVDGEQTEFGPLDVLLGDEFAAVGVLELVHEEGGHDDGEGHAAEQRDEQHQRPEAVQHRLLELVFLEARDLLFAAALIPSLRRGSRGVLPGRRDGVADAERGDEARHFGHERNAHALPGVVRHGHEERPGDERAQRRAAIDGHERPKRVLPANVGGIRRLRVLRRVRLQLSCSLPPRAGGQYRRPLSGADGADPVPAPEERVHHVGHGAQVVPALVVGAAVRGQQRVVGHEAGDAPDDADDADGGRAAAQRAAEVVDAEAAHEVIQPVEDAEDERRVGPVRVAHAVHDHEELIADGLEARRERRRRRRHEPELPVLEKR